MGKERRIIRPWMLIYVGLAIALAGQGGADVTSGRVSPVAADPVQPLFELDSIVRRTDI